MQSTTSAQPVLTERGPSSVTLTEVVDGRLLSGGMLAGASRSSLFHVVLIAGALTLWAATLGGVDPHRMTDFGLLSVLSPWYYVAIGLVTASFCIALYSAPRQWALLGAHVVGLLLMLHGSPAIIYGTLRYAWAWKHVGIVAYIVEHGSVNPNIGYLTAYQDWPSFFALAALIVQAGGFGDAAAFASWAPLFNNLLFAGAAMFLFRTLTKDRRQAWLAVWLFCITNWVGQDYFSPQANAYFLYLITIGICLCWLRPTGLPPIASLRRWLRSERLAQTARQVIARGLPLNQAGMLKQPLPAMAAIVFLLAAAIVTSHQLTPFMLILAISALVVFRLCVLRGLPLLILVMTAAWVCYMAVTFLKGNLYWIVASIGSLNIGSSTLSNLAVASHDHVIVAEVARLLTASVGAVAALGLWRRLRKGRADTAAVLLGVTSVLMVWGNAYGGEMLFRIYFFALPFLSFLAAGLIFPSPRAGRARLTPAAAMLVCAPLLAGMLVSYYGNERMNYISPDEVRAEHYLIAQAPPGSTLVSISADYPWVMGDYERYRFVQVVVLPVSQQRALIANPAGQAARLMGAGSGHAGYMIFSSSQAAEVEMTGELPAGSVTRIRDAMLRSPRFRVIYRGPDSLIFALSTQAGSA